MAVTKKKEKVIKSVKSVKSTKSAKPKAAETAKTNGNGAAGILPEDKAKIIETFAQGKGDTGSPEVQVALLSYKIERLAHHLDENKKDNHSRRGLLKVIAKRRRILNYLQKLDDARYKELIVRLGLKK